MKIFKLTLLFTIFLYKVTFSQLEIIVTSDFGNDTAKTCVNTEVTFLANVNFNGASVTNVNLKWDFDDGSEIVAGIDLFTVKYEFFRRKLHRVKVSAEYNGEATYILFPVEIGLVANFDSTKTDIDESFEGICPGEEFTLFGVAKDTIWKEELQTNFVEIFPYLIENPEFYSAPIDFRIFGYDDILTSGNQIKSVGLKIEHENISNVQIKIQCPNETEVIMKDFGGEAKYFGEPEIDDEGIAGTPYWYYWSDSPEYSDMNSESANFETLPSGIYASENSFDDLIGCPLNGEWKMIVIDNVDDDNGFITEWSIEFDEEIIPELYEYENNYLLSSCTWGGYGASSTNKLDGTCDVESSLEPGNYNYQFSIQDNFGCWNSTVLAVTVERASFNITKSNSSEDATEDGENQTDEISAIIGDKITFKDTTTWATDIMWDFGDYSPNKFEEEVFHYFLDEGYYQIIMQATSPKGCVDFDTAYIEMNPLDTVNMKTNVNLIFTPNGDGINDYFTIFDGDNGYPGGELVDSLKFTWENSIDKDASNISELTGRIYDRYGKTVCEWNTVEEALHGWDGTINNKGNLYVADGFYFYVVVVKIKNKSNDKKFDKLEPYKGTIFVMKEK